MAANIFEAKAEICYCVPNGAAACAPCRDRRASKKSPVEIFENYLDSKMQERIEENRLVAGMRCPECGSQLMGYSDQFRETSFCSSWGCEFEVSYPND